MITIDIPSTLNARYDHYEEKVEVYFGSRLIASLDPVMHNKDMVIHDEDEEQVCADTIAPYLMKLFVQ